MKRTVWLWDSNQLEITHGAFYGREIISTILKLKSESPIFDLWTGDLNTMFYAISTSPDCNPRDVDTLTNAFKPLAGFRATTEFNLTPDYLLHTFVLSPEGCREADDSDIDRITAMFQKKTRVQKSR
jgi:hypothetical protein